MAVSTAKKRCAQITAQKKECSMTAISSLYSNRANPDRLLRLREVLEIVPVSRTTWYDGMRIGLYPPSISLGGKRRAWVESQVLASIAALNKEMTLPGLEKSTSKTKRSKKTS